MAVSVDFVYKSVLLLANKSQVGSFITPEDFNNYSQISNLGLLDKLREQYQRTNKITDELKDFLKRRQLVVSELGRANFPNNYYFFDAMLAYDRDSYMALIDSGCELEAKDYAALPQISVKDTDHNKFGILNQSTLFRPSYEYPRVRLFDDYFQLNPVDIGMVELQYFKQPDTPVWGYTLDSYGLAVYDATTSTDFEWNVTMTNQLINDIAAHFGITIRDGDLVKAAAQLGGSGE